MRTIQSNDSQGKTSRHQKGKCKRCGKAVARYIETGENKNEADVAKHIRIVIKKYRTV